MWISRFLCHPFFVLKIRLYNLLKINTRLITIWKVVTNRVMSYYYNNRNSLPDCLFSFPPSWSRTDNTFVSLLITILEIYFYHFNMWWHHLTNPPPSSLSTIYYIINLYFCFSFHHRLYYIQNTTPHISKQRHLK